MGDKKSFKELGSAFGEKLDKFSEKVSEKVENFDSEEFSNKLASFGEKLANKTEEIKSTTQNYVAGNDYCSSCGKRINRFEKKEIVDGVLCKNCAEKYSRILKGKGLDLKNATFQDLLRFEKMGEEEKLQKKERNKGILKKVAIGFVVLLLISTASSLISGSGKKRHTANTVSPKTTTVSEPMSSSTPEPTVDSSKAELPFSYDELEGKDYKDIVAELESSGFSDFVVSGTDLLEKEHADKANQIEYISIGDNKEFKKGDLVDKNETVTIVYHSFRKENDSKQSESSSSSSKGGHLSYSTNDSKTAKNGDSGVYSYVKDGNYDLYYIIDFDEGYVYTFESGNGSTSCDKIKIDEGNLNDGLFFTYNDGVSVWTDVLHFKMKRQPNHLILVDSNGYNWEFFTTNLEKALKIRDTKTVVDYSN